ncbi:uncharacterized protein LOC103970883 [Musa acuminata AAA Group]|uniref:uncharacterized protein LOC103970883 n=1 Tax=Musa acuminata AAA Group TaxID=214697 RepID=UPI0031DFFD57
MAGSNCDPVTLRKLFHSGEIDFYCRLVRQLDQNPERMKQVIALWLWFESIGHHEFIQRVSSLKGDDVILGFVSEAEACLDRLMGHHVQTRGDELPLTSSLMAKKMDLRFFESHRDKAIEGVMHFFHSVCQIIFNDEPMERAAENANHPNDHCRHTSGLHDIRSPMRERRNQEEGGASTSAMAMIPPQFSTVPSPLRDMLNPMARPWTPEIVRSSDDQRSLFITFSMGQHISREEIKQYFNARYGPCVEVVLTERAPPGHQPMFGRLIFTDATMVARVLNGLPTAKFIINGKHLWARMYTPYQTRRVEALRLVKKLKRMPREGGTKGEVGEVGVMIDMMDCKSLTSKIIFMKSIIDPIV